MKPRSPIAVALSVSAFLGLAMAMARQAPPTPRPLDPGAVSVRLLLGVGETESKNWSGRVRLDKGEVLGLDGWRFRQDDRVVGPDAWEARTRALLKNANPVNKKAATNKKKAAAQKKAAAGAPAAAAVPNGVIVTLKAPTDAVLAVQTEGGNFSVP